MGLQILLFYIVLFLLKHEMGIKHKTNDFIKKIPKCIYESSQSSSMRYAIYFKFSVASIINIFFISTYNNGQDFYKFQLLLLIFLLPLLELKFCDGMLYYHGFWFQWCHDAMIFLEFY